MRIIYHSGNITLNAENSTPQFIDVVVLESNLTLNSSTSVLAGQDLHVFANLTLANGTAISNVLVTFQITLSPGGQIEQFVYTNGTGIAEIDISTYEGLDNVSVKALYQGNATINPSNSTAQTTDVIFLDTILSVQVINEILEGQYIEIHIFLKYVLNDSAIIGEEIQCNIQFQGSGSTIESATIAAVGHATIRIQVPVGTTKVIISVSYSGQTYIDDATLATDVQVSVITVLHIFLRYTYIWGPILAAAIGIPLAIKFGYSRPKKRKLVAKWEKSEQIFLDLANLEFFLINIRENGLNIFNYAFKGEVLNYELLGGFFTAITMFQRELFMKGAKEMAKDDSFELNYQNFKIYVRNYEEIMAIMILDGSPSEDLKVAADEFTKVFYQKHMEKIKNFDGELSTFRTSAEDVPKFFDIKFSYPHVVKPLYKGKVSKLKGLELDIYRAATTMYIQNKYFFIPNLIEMISSVRQEPRNQITDTIIELHGKGVFETIAFEDAAQILHTEAKAKPVKIEEIDEILGSMEKFDGK